MSISSRLPARSGNTGRAAKVRLIGVRYLRASRDRWGKAVSVASQDLEGEEFFEENGIEHLATYSDNNLSGSLFATEARGDYELALADIQSGRANLLWTWDSSRAQRDLEFYVRMRRICVDAGAFWAYGGRIYDMSDPQDRQTTARDAVSAEGRTDEIALHTRRGVRARARRGEHAGTVAYGYRPVYNPGTGRSEGWAVVEDEAEVIRRITGWVLDRRSLSWMARTLNAEGVPCPRDRQWNKRYVARVVEAHRIPREWRELLAPLTPEQREIAEWIAAQVESGKTPKEVGRDLNRDGVKHFFRCEWDAAKVRGIALSPPSAGLRMYHGDVVTTQVPDPDAPGGKRRVPVATAWVSIKTPQEHEQVTALLGDPQRRTRRDGERAKHRWTGIAVCGVCGGRMGLFYDKGVARVRCQPRSCVVRDYTLLDSWLTEQALQLLERQDVAQLFRVRESASAAHQAQDTAQELRARLDGLRAQAMAGKITPESFAMFEAGLLPQIAREDEKARRATLPPVLLDVLAEEGVGVREVFLALPVERQREVLRAIMRPRILRTRHRRFGGLEIAAIDPGFRYPVTDQDETTAMTG